MSLPSTHPSPFLYQLLSILAKSPKKWTPLRHLKSHHDSFKNPFVTIHQCREPPSPQETLLRFQTKFHMDPHILAFCFLHFIQNPPKVKDFEFSVTQKKQKFYRIRAKIRQTAFDVLCQVQIPLLMPPYHLIIFGNSLTDESKTHFYITLEYCDEASNSSILSLYTRDLIDQTRMLTGSLPTLITIIRTHLIEAESLINVSTIPKYLPFPILDAEPSHLDKTLPVVSSRIEKFTTVLFDQLLTIENSLESLDSRISQLELSRPPLHQSQLSSPQSLLTKNVPYSFNLDQFSSTLDAFEQAILFQQRSLLRTKNVVSDWSSLISQFTSSPQLSKKSSSSALSFASRHPFLLFFGIGILGFGLSSFLLWPAPLQLYETEIYPMLIQYHAYFEHFLEHFLETTVPMFLSDVDQFFTNVVVPKVSGLF